MTTPRWRNSTRRLIRSFGFRAEDYASAIDFLDSGRVQNTACLVLDVRMPDMDGLECNVTSPAFNCRIPIVFVTAHVNGTTRGGRSRGCGGCFCASRHRTGIVQRHRGGFAAGFPGELPRQIRLDGVGHACSVTGLRKTSTAPPIARLWSSPFTCGEKTMGIRHECASDVAVPNHPYPASHIEDEARRFLTRRSEKVDRRRVSLSPESKRTGSSLRVEFRIEASSSTIEINGLRAGYLFFP